MDKFEAAIVTETAEGFDRGKAEIALQDYLIAKIGGGASMFESREPGVIAMERLGWQDEDRIDWEELAFTLENEIGTPVACIDDADWSFDDRPDEEATYIAFAIPSLNPEYADEAARSTRFFRQKPTTP